MLSYTHTGPTLSYAMPQLKGMQEFTGDGCTHGQAWLAIFNRSTTCMDPHSQRTLKGKGEKEKQWYIKCLSK